MIKLLLLVLLGFVLYSFFQSLMRPSVRGATLKKKSDKQLTGEIMVEDPVCGTCLPQNDAVRACIKGEDYYFCSKICLDKFRQLNDDSPQS